MRLTYLILAATTLSSAGFTQQDIEIWPGATQFTSRGSIGNNATGGELLQGLHSTAFAGIGDVGGPGGTVSGFKMLLQDQNTDTQEKYQVVFRSGTDAAGPNNTAAGVICSAGPFTSPPRGTGGVIQAWAVSQAVQCRSLDLCGANFFGIRLAHPGAQTWSSNGLSVHMSRGDGTFAQTVQNAATTRPDMAWQMIDTGSGPVVSHPTLRRSWRFTLSTSAATLQMGNSTTVTGGQYGQGGPNPDVGQPFSARARYGAGVTSSLMYLGVTEICPGFRLPGVTTGMRIYIGPLYVGPFPAVPDAGGQAIHLLGTTPAISPNVDLFFQCIGIAGSAARVTNQTQSHL